jgi:hypothetical protein
MENDNREESQVQLDITYDGDALREGSMNVRDLAPSMLGIGSLFESANRALNGESANVVVNVKATSSGSFHILYDVIQSQGYTLPIGDIISNAVGMKELLFGGAIALFYAIKILRGKSPKVEKINDGLFKLTIDNQTYEVPPEWLKLYQDINVRRSLSDIVKPVKTDGIDTFEIRENNRVIQSAHKDDVDSFIIPDVRQPLVDEISQRAFSVISLAFEEDYKWRLTEGEVKYSVSMKDEAFLDRVTNMDLSALRIVSALSEVDHNGG